MSAPTLNKCDSAKQIFNFKILTDGKSVNIKNSICTGHGRPEHYLKQEKISKMLPFVLFSDNADSAKKLSNTKNSTITTLMA
jgi:hypothetical protein